MAACSGDAGSLSFGAHEAVLRCLVDAVGRHAEGPEQAARVAWQRTSVSSKEFIHDLHAELKETKYAIGEQLKAAVVQQHVAVKQQLAVEQHVHVYMKKPAVAMQALTEEALSTVLSTSAEVARLTTGDAAIVPLAPARPRR